MEIEALELSIKWDPRKLLPSKTEKMKKVIYNLKWTARGIVDYAIKDIPDEDLAREEVAQKGTIILRTYSQTLTSLHDYEAPNVIQIQRVGRAHGILYIRSVI